MAGQLSQDANVLAADAAKTISDVIGNASKPRRWVGRLRKDRWT
jgi:hypothetical protein